MKTIQRIEWFTILLFLILGFLAIVWPIESSYLLIRSIGILGLLSSLVFLIDGIRKKRIFDFIGTAVGLLFFVVVLVHWNQDDTILSGLFIFYYTLISLVFFIQAVLDWKDHSKDWKVEVGMGLLYLALSSIGYLGLRDVQLLFGIYLILQAVQLILEQHYFSSPYNARYYGFRDFMYLPAWFISVFPSFVISELVRRRIEKKATHFDAKKSEEEPDLRVWVHTGVYGTTLYGHMTFSYKSIMYSYGDYDVPKMRFFKTMGPGIFFSVNDEIYANNCCIVEHCPLFEYGIRLTKEQKQAFEKMSDAILADSKPWKCGMQKAELEANKELPLAQFEHIYANRLWYRTCALFRKYDKTQWAWYSLLGNNCSNYSSAMLNSIGLSIPVSKGIVSPGEFFEYFEEAYQDPDSNVISKAWHSARVPSTLFKTID